MSVGGKGNRTRKTLSFFRVNFGHAPPYEVLCDGPTIVQSLKNDLYLKQSLPKLLGGPAYPVVTECVVKELRTLGDDYSNAALFAKRVKRVSCVHEGKASVAECLTSLLRTPPEVKFVLATTDPDVVARVTRIPGIPIVSIMNQKKFVLKAPSTATLRFVKESEKKKTQSLSDPDKALVDRVKAAEEQLLEKRFARRKRKRAKGPNPLSVKKAKMNHRKSDEGPQQLSSHLSGSVKSPSDSSLRHDKHHDEVDHSVSSRTRGHAFQIKVHQSKNHALDAAKDEDEGNRIKRGGNDSNEIPDPSTNNAIKDMDESQKKSSTGSCITSKPNRKTRRKYQKRKDDTEVAANTSVDLSRSVSRLSADLQEEGNVTLKDKLNNVVVKSHRQKAQDIPVAKAEYRKRMPRDIDTVTSTESNADENRPRPLVCQRPALNAEEPESRKGNESKQVGKSISGISQNDNNTNGPQSITKGCQDAVCDTDNAQVTATAETQETEEHDMETTITETDGKKKKKQRKNRRRRPKKNISI